MALSESIHGSVATPRIYVDYIQYAKAIGYVDRYICGNVANFPVEDGSVWDFDPTNMNRYYHDGIDPAGNFHFGVRFKNWEGTPENKQWSLFLETINYYGILGHSMGTQCREGIGLNIVNSYMYNDSQQLGESMFTSSQVAGIVGDAMSCSNDVGFSMYEIIKPGGYSENNNWSRYGLFFYKQAEQQSQAPFSTNEYLDLGCLTAGRYFDFPHNANLSMNIKHTYDGVKSKRTQGGSDLTEIKYTKPNWGNLPAWEHIDVSSYTNPEDYFVKENYSRVTNTSRRSWDLTFSYLQKDDTFPKKSGNNILGEYLSAYDSFDDAGAGKINMNLVNNFIGLTMGGQIPFLLQPDKTKKDFCMCKLQKNGVSIQQSAPDLYTCKLSFVEVW